MVRADRPEILSGLRFACRRSLLCESFVVFKVARDCPSSRRYSDACFSSTLSVLLYLTLSRKAGKDSTSVKGKSVE
jgi:hypothetical protein